VSIKVAAHAG